MALVAKGKERWDYFGSEVEDTGGVRWNYNSGLASLKHYWQHLTFFKGRPFMMWRYFLGYFKTRVLKQRVLRSVELAVTYDCNLRCDKCFALKWLNEENKRDYMTVDQIKKMWDEAYKLGAVHVNITGGEPLMRRDIVDVVKALKPKRTLVSIVTTGIFLTEEKARELKKAGLNTFQISLDSSIAVEHDKYRGYKGSYEKVFQAVEIARKTKPGVTVHITTYGEFPAPLQKTIEEKGVKDHFHFLGYIKDESEFQEAVQMCRIGLAPYAPGETTVKNTAGVGRPWTYMRNGVPPIITRVPADALEIEEAQAGILIDYTKEDLANAILSLLSDDKMHENYRKKGVELSMSRSSVPVMTKLLNDLGFIVEDPETNIERNVGEP